MNIMLGALISMPTTTIVHTHINQITKFTLNGTSPQNQHDLESQITNNVFESHNFHLYPTHEIS
jgi:hypothetical protein